ncbi:hypothetical protein UlMin_019569 [Ulmus minor]
MASKRPSPLEAPPNASSSEEEEEGASGSRSRSKDEEEASPAVDKKPLSKKSNTTTANSLGSDSNSGSNSDAEPEGNHQSGALDPNIKPITSKPMEEMSNESKVKNSKCSKKKAPEEDVVTYDGATAPVEEDSKKFIDEMKLFQRLFSEDDEIVILKGMLDYIAKKREDPSADMDVFLDFIKNSLHTDFTKNKLSNKIRRLRKKYLNNVRKGNNPTKPHEHKGFELSKKIWGGEGTSKEKLHIAELELFVKWSQLISEQAKLMLQVFKSTDH